MRDALGSVTGTIPNKVVANTYRYKPYGERLAKNGTAPDPRFQWNGTSGYRQTSISHSSSYVRRRHLGQEEGRWTTVDPLWPWEMAYRYVNCFITNAIDPLGLRPTSLQNSQSGGKKITIPIPGPGKCIIASFCFPPHPCSKPGVDPCKYVSQPPPAKDGPVWGRAICCDGKLIPCSWLPPDGERDSIVRGCTRAHEQFHINDSEYRCPPCGASQAISTNPSIGDPFNECRASIVGLSCYMLSCSLAGYSVSCLTKRKKYICSACAYAQKNCRLGGFSDFVPPGIRNMCRNICNIEI